MRRLALAVTLAAGCGYPAQPGQPEAEALVWQTVYAAPPGTAPPVEWREDRCDGPLAGAHYDGHCYAGLYLRDDHALVAWRGTFHDSSYAHELMHALQWQHGVDDPDHQRPEWRLVDSANQRLAASGL